MYRTRTYGKYRLKLAWFSYSSPHIDRDYHVVIRIGWKQPSAKFKLSKIQNYHKRNVKQNFLKFSNRSRVGWYKAKYNRVVHVTFGFYLTNTRPLLKMSLESYIRLADSAVRTMFAVNFGLRAPLSSVI